MQIKNIYVAIINEEACRHVHTSRGKNLIDDYSWQPQCYSQWYLSLPIPGSRLNTRNALGTHPLCNRQLLKNFCGLNEPRKFNTRKTFYLNCFFTWKFPDLRYLDEGLYIQTQWPKAISTARTQGFPKGVDLVGQQSLNLPQNLFLLSLITIWLLWFKLLSSILVCPQSMISSHVPRPSPSFPSLAVW